MAEHVQVGFVTALADKANPRVVTDVPVEGKHAVTDARLQKLCVTSVSVL
jgi:hypothetical protein